MTETRAVATATAPSPPTVAAEQSGSDVRVINIAGRGQVERVATKLTIPPDFMYAIDKWSVNGQRPDGKPNFVKEVTSVGLTIDAYEYMNRVVGASFFLPPHVQDENGNMVANPMYDGKDKTRVLMGATWYNLVGQLCVSYELVSVDFFLMYLDALAKKGEVRVDPEGGPVFKDGEPVLDYDAKDVKSVYLELTGRRALGPRYAQSVARVRLLKQATGYRSLPIKELRSYEVGLVGYRDGMDPVKRIAAVTEAEEALYGGLALPATSDLTAEEKAAVARDEATTASAEATAAAAIEPPMPTTDPNQPLEWAPGEIDAALAENQPQS